MEVFGLCVVGLAELAFFGIGIYIFVDTLLARSRGIRSGSWPVVEGIISNTGIREVEASDENSSRTIYVPEIHYSYEFGGAQYRSSRVSFEEIQSFGDRKKAGDWLSRYQTGTQIRVYCNPEKPQESVLEPGFRTKKLVQGLWAALCSVAIGMTIFFLSLPEMSKADWPGLLEQIMHGITNWLKSLWLSRGF